MLRLILGRSGVGKSFFINHEIVHHLPSGYEKTMILLVPEQYTLEAEKGLLEAGKLEGLIQVEVLSFQRLAHRIFTQVGGIKGKEVNQLGRIMALRHIINKSESLGIYKGMRGKEGFLEEIHHLFVEMMRSNINPKVLSLSPEDDLLSKKLRDIAYLYKEYRSFLAPLFHDREERFQLLAKRIPKTPFLKGSLFWMDGFRGFSGQEYLVIKALLPVVEALTIGLTYHEEEGDLFEPTEKTYHRLKDLAFSSRVKVEEIRLEKSYIQSPLIQHLESNLYGFSPNPYPGQVQGIGLFPGQTPEDEVQEVAKEILFLVSKKAYRFREIVVVTGLKEVYHPLIRRIFPQYKIPFFLDEKRSIIESPIIRAILSVLRIGMKGFSYRDLFIFLKTGFGPLTRDEWEELEGEILDRGLERKEPLFRDENLPYQRILQQLFGPFIDSCKERGKASYYTEKFEAFLKRLGLEKKVEAWLEDLQEEGRGEYGEEVSQILDAVTEVFSQIQDLLGEEEMDVTEYYTILEAGFFQCELGVIPPTLDQVLVGDLERSRSHRMRALFLLGVNEGVLPGEGKERGLFLEEEKAFLQQEGLELTDTLTLHREERFNIYSLLSKPNEYLKLTYALTHKGKTLQPSLLMKRIVEIFLALQEQDLTPRDPLLSPTPTFFALMHGLSEYRKQGEISSFHRQLLAWYAKKDEWKERLSFLLDYLFSSPKEVYLLKEQVRYFYQPPLSLSPSQLERFLQCPFAYFIQVILKPEEKKKYEVMPLDLGNILHQALDSFTREIKKRDYSWEDLEESISSTLMDAIIDDICKRYGHGLFHARPLNQFFIQFLKKVGKRTVFAIKEQLTRGAFRLFQSEVTFGEGGILPPLSISLPGDEYLMLEGRIDRLDSFEMDDALAIRVIDYKSGSGQRFSLGEAYHGLRIQLFVYLAAVMKGKERLGNKEIIPAGLFYYVMKDPLLEEELEEELEERILRELQLDGFLIGEEDLLRAHDLSLVDGQSSLLVPLRFKKDGELAKTSKLLRPREFSSFMHHFMLLLQEKGKDLLDGRITVEPVRVNREKRSAPCNYCHYQSICNFDPPFSGHYYRDIYQKKDWEIRKELEGEGDEAKP